MTRRKQDVLTKAERLESGRCPKHGTGLCQTGVGKKGPIIACPRKDCTFKVYVAMGTALYKKLYPRKETP